MRLHQLLLLRILRARGLSKNPTFIESTSVIGNYVHIRKGCKLVRTKVNPGLTLPPGMTYRDKFLQNYTDVAELAS